MQPSNNLFLLISSLSKSEKRYFKVYSKRHIQKGGNHYIKLFDAIDKQKEYDELSLKDRFKGEPFINYFRSEKQYLTELILECLNLYHSKKNVNLIIANKISSIEILYNRGLFDHAKLVLENVKNIINQYDVLFELPKIYNWERKLIVAKSYNKTTENDLNEIGEKEEEGLKKIINLSAYRALADQIFFIFKKQVNLRNIEELKKLDEFMENDLLQNESKAISFTAKKIFYNIKSAYYHFKNDWKNNYEYTKKLYTLLFNKPKQIEGDVGYFLNITYNYILACVALQKDKEFYSLLKILKSIPEKYKTNSENTKLKVFILSNVSLLSYNLGRGNFKNVQQCITEVIEGLEKYKQKINKSVKMVFYFQIAYFYFGLNIYDKSLFWLNNVLNIYEKGIRQDIYVCARLLNMIAHYELGNQRLLDYLASSNKYHLKKQKVLYKFEERIIYFFGSEIIKVVNRQQLKNLFIQLKSDLVNICSDPLEKKAIEYFNFIAWTDSKISGKTFAETILLNNK